MELTFEDGDCVYLKVSPMKGFKRFVLKGKLSPRYIGLYQVTGKVDLVTYQVALPIEYEGIHNVFHVSPLKKSFRNQQPQVIEPNMVPLQLNLSYEENMVRIID